MRLLITAAMALLLVACGSGAPPAKTGRSSAKPDVASLVAAVRAAGAATARSQVDSCTVAPPVRM